MQKSEIKVVAHLHGGKLVKGFLKCDHEADVEALFRHEGNSLGSEIPIRSHTSSKLIKLGANSLKAIFFVKTFEGSAEYNEVKFFQSNPAVEGLWVQLRFQDGEVTEGVLYNSIRYIVEAGFFLKPPDPLSNNQLIYVLKKSLAEFRVLGVRSKY